MPRNIDMIGRYPMVVSRYTQISRAFAPIAIGFILLLTFVVPPFGILTYGTSSMAAGVLVVSAMYILLFVIFCVISGQSQSLRVSVLHIAAILGIVIAHGVVSWRINAGFDLSRFCKTCMFLGIFLLSASFFTVLAQRVTGVQADFAVRLVFYTLLLFSVVEILHLSPFTPGGVGPHVFLYSEASHFALNFLPFLLYATVTASPRTKLALILLSYIVALSLHSATMFTGIILVAILTLRLRRLLLFLIVVFLSFYFTDVNLDYYSSRVFFSFDSENMSVLVNLSGWERAYLNFKDTLGLGVGFQQFGLVGKRGEAMFWVEKIAGVESNLYDGGTVATKVFGEFGCLGVATLLVYLYYFAKGARWLHEVSIRRVAHWDCRSIFFLSCFVMYCIDLFIRGVGYFSSSGFLFVASLIWMRQSWSRTFKKLISELVVSLSNPLVTNSLIH